MRKGFVADEGVVFIGKAQEKSSVFRTKKRTNPKTGHKYPWIVRVPALVNHYYFYIVDRNFGPLFIKFGSYFPYTAKLCINGHEWLKRQLEQEGIAYEALDNGILSCADPARVQQIATTDRGPSTSLAATRMCMTRSAAEGGYRVGELPRFRHPLEKHGLTLTEAIFDEIKDMLEGKGLLRRASLRYSR